MPIALLLLDDSQTRGHTWVVYGECSGKFDPASMEPNLIASIYVKIYSVLMNILNRSCDWDTGIVKDRIKSNSNSVSVFGEQCRSF